MPLLRSLGWLCVVVVVVLGCLTLCTTAGYDSLTGWRDPSLPVQERVELLLSQLSAKEKIEQLDTDAPAIERLDIPAFNWWTECLHGVMDLTGPGGTIFPNPMSLAATFDTDLLYDIGTMISDEMRAKFNHDLSKTGQHRWLNCFSPNINIFRDPRWGRGFETYGEDPHLTSRLVVPYVKGLQGNDTQYVKVGATCKHYAAYSLEEAEGISRYRFDAQVSAEDAMATYLPAFEACVREGGARSVMCSYNSVNGVPACASKDLLQDKLRQDWSFDGFVVSDCGAVDCAMWAHHYRDSYEEGDAATLQAGTDMACTNYAPLQKALREGLVSEEDVDQAVERVFTARFQLGMLDPPDRVPYADISTDVVGSKAHIDKAVEAVRKGIVLLKNLDTGNGHKLLPLDAKTLKKVVVSGSFAIRSDYLLGNYYGKPAGNVTTPLKAIQDYLEEHGNATVDFRWGAKVDGWGSGGVDDTANDCYDADVCILVVGTSAVNSVERAGPDGRYDLWSSITEGEGLDRTSLTLPGCQEDVIKAAAKFTNTSIVVLLIHGGPVDISWLQETERVGAILTAWYPGQGAAGIADVLFGEVSPSGRLPVTFYYDNYTSQIPMTDMAMTSYPGRTYRYVQVPVLYPFGYGLSYTDFSYSNLQLAPVSSALDPHAVQASVTVQNTGSMASDEVVMLYLKPPTRPHLPSKSLRGFERVHLAVGERATVDFTLFSNDFTLPVQGGNTAEVVHGEWTVVIGTEAMSYSTTSHLLSFQQ